MVLFFLGNNYVIEWKQVVMYIAALIMRTSLEITPLVARSITIKLPKVNTLFWSDELGNYLEISGFCKE